MYKNKCCVVIITHKSSFNDTETKSVKKAIDVFKDVDVNFITPEYVKTGFSQLLTENCRVTKVNNSWLSSYEAYNKTLTSPDFYLMFSDYDYILTYQADCFVFENKLDYFADMGYDWYGAAWQHYNDAVGNGGFSLRKVSKMIDVCKRRGAEFNGGAEDVWFCCTLNNELNKCDLKTACNFSCENLPKRYCELIDTVPMGLHGRNMLSYWDYNKILKEIHG